MQANCKRATRAAEHRCRAAGVKALPRGEAQDLLVTFAEAPERAEHISMLP